MLFSENLFSADYVYIYVVDFDPLGHTIFCFGNLCHKFKVALVILRTMTRANLNKSKNLVTNTTKASKYVQCTHLRGS